jgi:hypothetical protein
VAESEAKRATAETARDPLEFAHASGPSEFVATPSNAEIQAAIAGAAANVLRAAAVRLRKRAQEGTALAEAAYPGVAIRSPEAALAARQARDWDEIADCVEAGLP